MVVNEKKLTKMQYVFQISHKNGIKNKQNYEPHCLREENHLPTNSQDNAAFIIASLYSGKAMVSTLTDFILPPDRFGLGEKSSPYRTCRNETS